MYKPSEYKTQNNKEKLLFECINSINKIIDFCKDNDKVEPKNNYVIDNIKEEEIEDNEIQTLNETVKTNQKERLIEKCNGLISKRIYDYDIKINERFSVLSKENKIFYNSLIIEIIKKCEGLISKNNYDYEKKMNEKLNKLSKNYDDNIVNNTEIIKKCKRLVSKSIDEYEKKVNEKFNVLVKNYDETNTKNIKTQKMILSIIQNNSIGKEEIQEKLNNLVKKYDETNTKNIKTQKIILSIIQDNSVNNEEIQEKLNNLVKI